MIPKLSKGYGRAEACPFNWMGERVVTSVKDQCLRKLKRGNPEKNELLT